MDAPKSSILGQPKQICFMSEKSTASGNDEQRLAAHFQCAAQPAGCVRLPLACARRAFWPAEVSGSAAEVQG